MIVMMTTEHVASSTSVMTEDTARAPGSPPLACLPPASAAGLTFWLVRASFMDTYSEIGMMLELHKHHHDAS